MSTAIFKDAWKESKELGKIGLCAASIGTATMLSGFGIQAHELAVTQPPRVQVEDTQEDTKLREFDQRRFDRGKGLVLAGFMIGLAGVGAIVSEATFGDKKEKD